MLKLRSNELTAFIVENSLYRIVATKHAIDRYHMRGVSKYYIASACLALGEKLETYNNSGNQIMICDSGKNMSSLVSVENYTIVVITVLDKSDPFVMENTIVENFQGGMVGA